MIVKIISAFAKTSTPSKFNIMKSINIIIPIRVGEMDGKKILLSEAAEPNRLIRNIVSRIPRRLSERLEYLAKFDFEEDTDSDSEEDNSKNVEKRLKPLRAAVTLFIELWLKKLFETVY
jgi:hypothetical protein